MPLVELRGELPESQPLARAEAVQDRLVDLVDELVSGAGVDSDGRLRRLGADPTSADEVAHHGFAAQTDPPGMRPGGAFAHSTIALHTLAVGDGMLVTPELTIEKLRISEPTQRREEGVMLALRLTAWKHEAELLEVPQPDPGPGQVLVRIAGAGACHSDLHLMDEFEPGMVPWEPPFTLGHENAGWV